MVTGGSLIPSFGELSAWRFRRRAQRFEREDFRDGDGRMYESDDDEGESEEEGEVGDGMDNREGGGGVVEGGVGGSRAYRLSKRRQQRRAAREAAREVRERLIEEQRIRTEVEYEQWKERKKREDRIERRLRARQLKKGGWIRWLKGLIGIDEGSMKERRNADRSKKEKEFEKLMQALVDLVLEKKIVIIEEVAAKFQVHTEFIVRCLKLLDKQGRIVGVLDGEKRYIQVTADDMKEIAMFMQEKGIVRIDDLAAECTRVVTRDIAIGSTDREVMQGE